MTKSIWLACLRLWQDSVCKRDMSTSTNQKGIVLEFAFKKKLITCSPGCTTESNERSRPRWWVDSLLSCDASLQHFHRLQRLKSSLGQEADCDRAAGSWPQTCRALTTPPTTSSAEVSRVARIQQPRSERQVCLTSAQSDGRCQPRSRRETECETHQRTNASL